MLVEMLEADFAAIAPAPGAPRGRDDVLRYEDIFVDAPGHGGLDLSFTVFAPPPSVATAPG